MISLEREGGFGGGKRKRPCHTKRAKEVDKGRIAGWSRLDGGERREREKARRKTKGYL